MRMRSGFLGSSWSPKLPVSCSRILFPSRSACWRLFGLCLLLLLLLGVVVVDWLLVVVVGVVLVGVVASCC